MSSSNHIPGLKLTNVPKTLEHSLHSVTTSVTKPRRRYLAACQPCHRRKIKCDVTVKGQPCSACTTDGRATTECVVMANKRARNLPKIPQPTLHTSSSHASPQALELLPHSFATVSPNSQSLTEQSSIYSSRQAELHSLDDVIGQGYSCNITLKNESGASTSHQFTHPGSFANCLRPEDLAYLQATGALSVPVNEVCEDLVKSYFRNIHPWLPIIDATDFLNRYVEGGPLNVNLLLIWAVFLAGSIFVTQETCALAGFVSKSEMSQSFFRRAKVLFDTKSEDNKMVVIQAVIIMAYCHQSENGDLSGSWHWLGIAISLCQALGLHRNPRPSNGEFSPDLGGFIWRRMWWACVASDCWLALGYGKPLRTNLTDNKFPPLSLNEILYELKYLPLPIRESYILPEIDTIGLYYVHLLKLSLVLGCALDRYQSNKDTTLAELEEREEKYSKIYRETQDLASRSPWASTDIVKLAACHLEICYAGAYIALWRPYLFETPNGLPAMQLQIWHTSVHQRMREAAARSNSALEKVIRLDMVLLLKHFTLTALIPTMQFYLIDLVCCRPLARQLAKQKFDNCLLVLSEMQETYWQTGFVCVFFKRALQQVLAQQEDNFQEPSRDAHSPNVNTPVMGSTINLPPESTSSLFTLGIQTHNDANSLINLDQDMFLDNSHILADLPWNISQMWDDIIWQTPD